MKHGVVHSLGERNESRILKLREKYGVVAYGAYQMLKECLYEAGGVIAKDTAVAYAVSWGIENLGEIIDRLIQYELLLVDEKNQLYIPEIIDHLLEQKIYKDQLSKQRAEAGRKGGKNSKRPKKVAEPDNASMIITLSDDYSEIKKVEQVQQGQRTEVDRKPWEIVNGGGQAIIKQIPSKSEANDKQNISKEEAKISKSEANLLYTIGNILNTKDHYDLYRSKNVEILKRGVDERIQTCPHLDVPFKQLTQPEFLEQLHHFDHWLPQKLLERFYKHWGYHMAVGKLRFQNFPEWNLRDRLHAFLETEKSIQERKRNHPYSPDFNTTNTLDHEADRLRRKQREEAQIRRNGTDNIGF